jgi:urease subunit beta/urease subunit gamma/beta
MIPGEYFLKRKPVICNEDRRTLQITVTNKGDRPIQVGSHFHFFEVNRKMSFDREKAFGMHLNIIAGTAVRFEPGEEKTVELVDIGGLRRVYGHNNLVNGDISLDESKDSAMKRVQELNFLNVKS